MRGIRRLVLVALTVLAVGASLPAGAKTSAPVDLAGMSRWVGSIEIVGLSDPDVVAVQRLWGEFVTGLPAQAACLVASPPRVEGKSGLGPRAAYSPSTATLFVRPGDLERLVVFHELAHHLDFTCGASEAIGADLRVAQNLSPTKAWWNEGAPVTWPAEYFANAVAIALGESSRHNVTAGTVALVEQWTGSGAEPPTVDVATPVPSRTITLDSFDALGVAVF